MRLFITVMTLIFSDFAFSKDIRSTIDHRGVINLRSSVSKLEYRYNYPGMSDGVVNSPDCLVLISNGDAPIYVESLLQKLADELVVADGQGVLFPGHGDSAVNILPAQILNTENSFQYNIADLEKYVTGLRVSTKSGKTLSQVVQQLVGSQNFVGLQLLRGCKF